MATMFSITHDPTLLHGGARGGAIDIYEWLVTKGLVNPSTGDQTDGMSTDTCRPGGGVNIKRIFFLYCTPVHLLFQSYSYEYGVLVQGLMALADATGNQTYITHALTYVRNAFTKFTRNNVIYEGCDESNTCSGDGMAFRGTLVVFERLQDSRFARCLLPWPCSFI